MTSDSDTVTEGFIQQIKDTMGISENFLVQVFDKEWENWIDVELGDVLQERSTLRCVVFTKPADSIIISSDRFSLSNVDTPHKDSSVIDMTASIGDLNSSTASASSAQGISHGEPGCSSMPLRISHHATIVDVEIKMSTSLLTSLGKGEQLTWAAKHDLLTAIADKLFGIDHRPSSEAKRIMASSLVTRYPHLKERLGTGYVAWYVAIENKLKNMRRLSSMTTEPEKDSRLKSKEKSERKVGTLPIKKARLGELNWCPPIPATEDDTSIELHISTMKRELTKRPCDRDLIKKLMDLTYPSRRVLVNADPPKPIGHVKDVYPALFTVSEAYNEFNRLTGIDLKQIFMAKFGRVAGKIISYAKRKKKVSDEIASVLSEMDT